MKRQCLLFCLCVAFSTAFAGGNEEIDGLLKVRSYPGPVDTPNQVLIKNATVWTQDKKGTLTNHDLLIEDGKIKKIGKSLRAGKNALVIDAAGKHVTPGLIDAHSHSATDGGWAAGVNETGTLITPQVRIKDVLSAQNTQIYRELAGGLTTANLLHGSANPIGGQNVVHKLRWGAATSDDLIFKAAPQGIKFALGENPKRVHKYPDTRMGVMMIIQNAFTDAEAYAAEWAAYNALGEAEKEHAKPPRKHLQHEAMAEVLAGTRLIHSHGYRQDEFLALLRLTQEKGITIATLQHVLEGYKIADEIAAAGVGASTFSDWWSYKIEAYDAIPFNAALMHERGVLVSVNSDDAGLARRMNLEAAKSIRYGGLSPQEALNLITINPAKQLRVDKRTGSLVKGKDADVVIWNGDPLHMASRPDYTFVDGIIRFSRETDLAHRKKVTESRAKLIEMIKSEGKKEAKEAEKKDTEEGDKKEAAKEKTDKEKGQKKDKKKPEIKPNPDHPQFPYHMSPLAPSKATAIVGAQVHTISGEPIANGVVVIKDGKIVAVGDASTPVPDGATVYDAKGKHLWPGMIHAASHVGLHEIGAVEMTVDHEEQGQWNPELISQISVNPDSTHIPVARSAGITHSVVLPGDNLLAGVSSLMKTNGWTWEEMTAVGKLNLSIKWPRGVRKKTLEENRKATEKKIKPISEFFDNAEHYRKAKQEAGDKPFKTNAKFEAMLPILAGEVPLYIKVDQSWSIKQAHQWASARGLSMVVVGGSESFKITDYLVANNLPVVLDTSLFNPEFADDPYDVAYTLPGKLAEAGVLFAIAGPSYESETVRNIIEHAGYCTGFGLSKEDAYRSVTLNPAKILGVDESLGSIEKGKNASLVLTQGDLLEVTSVVEQVWIDGIECDMGDKHKQLYERYRARPKAK